MVLHLLISGQLTLLFTKAGTITISKRTASLLSIFIDSRVLPKERAESVKSHFMVSSRLIAMHHLTSARQRSHLMDRPLSLVQLLSMPL